MCFNNVNVLKQETGDKSWLFNNISTPEISDLDDLLKGINYIATNSVVVRTKLIQSLPGWYSLVPFGDYALHLIVSSQGKIKYIDEVMGIYRLHSGGIFSPLLNSLEGRVKVSQEDCRFWFIIQKSGLIEEKKLFQPMSFAMNNLVLSSEQVVLSLENSLVWKLRNKLLIFKSSVDFFIFNLKCRLIIPFKPRLLSQFMKR